MPGSTQPQLIQATELANYFHHAVNDAADGVADAYAVDEDASLSVAADKGVLANDSDIDGDAISAVLLAGPAHGELVLYDYPAELHGPIRTARPPRHATSPS